MEHLLKRKTPEELSEGMSLKQMLEWMLLEQLLKGMSLKPLLEGMSLNQLLERCPRSGCQRGMLRRCCKCDPIMMLK